MSDERSVHNPSTEAIAHQVAAAKAILVELMKVLDAPAKHYWDTKLHLTTEIIRLHATWYKSFLWGEPWESDDWEGYADDWNDDDDL